MGMLMSMMDQSIVNIALPTLTRAFHSEFSVVQWIVLAYMLTVTTLMLGVARLGDMVGTKPVYVAGVIIFTAASAACGIHISIAWLIGARVVQGIGAAMIAAIGAAIIAETFPPHERGKAIGIVSSVAAVGIVLGPTLGGVLLSAFSWHWLFLINLPIGVVTVALATRFIGFVPPVGGQRWRTRARWCPISRKPSSPCGTPSKPISIGLRKTDVRTSRTPSSTHATLPFE